MTELVTAARMRAIEQAAIGTGDVTGLALMERAGQGVVQSIFAVWPALSHGGAAPKPPRYLPQDERRAVVLCGPGNNGGDGFVIARLLSDRGWTVDVFLYGSDDRLPPDARVNHDRWSGMGPVRDAQELREAGVVGQLYIDALFGTGLTRPLAKDAEHSLRRFCDLALQQSAPMVAVDVPSGMCADSGRSLVDGLFELRADLTVTFGYRKPGQYLADGPARCGRLICIDIGLPVEKHEASAARIMLNEGQDLRPEEPGGQSVLDKVSGVTGAHKFSYGHALVLAGPPGLGGAARLAARGALRIGAGLVTVGCAPDALAEHAARLDAIMLRAVADADALGGMLQDRRINAVCLGPGLGLDARAASVVAKALEPVADHPRALVLDADALTILSRNPALIARLPKACVLTPHAGEFARLFPDIAEKLAAPALHGPAYSKVDATRDAAARVGCVVLFKGPDTVIADPSGRCSLNSAQYDRAAPWLATAGSGDVLAGFIAGLLARGFAPFDAARTAAWLHVECARSFGSGLIAEDLPEELPKVFRALGLQTAANSRWPA